MQIGIFSIAKKNLSRRLFRSISISISVMIVAATLFVVTTIMSSVETSLNRATARLGADIMVVPKEAEVNARKLLLSGEPSLFYMDKSVEDQVRKTEGVAHASSEIFLKTSEYKCCATGNMFIIGFDQKNDFTIMPWLSTMSKRKIEANEAVAGMAVTLYTLGSETLMYGSYFKIIGLLEETGMKFLDESLFLPYEALDKMRENSKNKDVKELKFTKDQISNVLVQVAPEFSPERVAIFIEYNINGVKAIVTDQVISAVRKQLFVLIKSIIIISIVLWVMTLLLIGIVFSMIVNERQREIGLLRAMGAKKSHIFKIILTEASVLSAIGGIAGIAVGGGGLYFFKGFIRSSLNIPYLWPSPLEYTWLILFCFILSVLTGLLAVLYPAAKSMLMEPYNAIRRGE
ncbi:MAG: FtsX-like permease family protein [Nitrospirae bacterium]|nr:FtsX-like permease family protein [Nitrospirota bacterium]MBF0540807.1 FtsX-like permease family protein [Nitrospirota bacterium]